MTLYVCEGCFAHAATWAHLKHVPGCPLDVGAELRYCVRCVRPSATTCREAQYVCQDCFVREDPRFPSTERKAT